MSLPEVLGLDSQSVRIKQREKTLNNFNKYAVFPHKLARAALVFPLCRPKESHTCRICVHLKFVLPMLC